MTPPAESGLWWLRTAFGDLATARILVQAGTAQPRNVAQFAHQSAEKALKAAIASTGETPARTHDLVYLALRCEPEVRRALASIDVVELAAVLSRSRYPEPGDPPISRVNATKWLADAADIFAIAAGHLGVDTDALVAA